MRNSTVEYLIDYLITHSYGKYSDYDFNKLFKMYSALEVSSLSDLPSAIDDFCDFLDTYCDLIETTDPNHKERIPSKVASLKYNLKSIFDIRKKQNQKAFAEIVTKITPSNNAHALDVGASTFPYSSIIMAKKLERVTSMDNEFYLSDASLGSMNVCTKEQFFKNDTAVDDYDIVVGRFPCSAIVPIVKTCSKANKPYFLELCECDIPWPQNYTPGTYFGWENVLPEFDPHVHIVDGYAFNIDATPRQIQKIINKLSKYRIPDRNRKIYFSNKKTPVQTIVIPSSAWNKDAEEIEMI